MILIRFAIIFLLAVALFSNNITFLKNGLISFLNKEDKLGKLELERDSLKMQLYIAENLGDKQIKTDKWNYLRADVFSAYPFNNQNLISINKGVVDGLNNDYTVAAEPMLLVGQIIRVDNNTSLVRTIFDEEFTAAVKIGDKKVNALLKGGNPPSLEMISKDGDIQNGDIVYNADANFPYGFKFGETQLMSSNDVSGPFKKAYVKTNYNPALLDNVLVVTDFQPLRKQ